VSIENTVKCFTIADIVSKVEEVFGLTTVDVLANKRARGKVVLARQVAIYLCREMTNVSLVQTAKAFGLKDHTPVIRAQRKIAEQLRTDAELQSIVENIKTKLSE
jgi:chromosomal replication initiator protein